MEKKVYREVDDHVSYRIERCPFFNYDTAERVIEETEYAFMSIMQALAMPFQEELVRMLLAGHKDIKIAVVPRYEQDGYNWKLGVELVFTWEV